MSDWERVSPNSPATCEAPASNSVLRPVKDRTYCNSPAVLYFLPGGYRGTNGAWAFGASAICAAHNEENRIYEDVNCNECGDYVGGNSGKFINRVSDWNAPSDRFTMGKAYPYGAYVCDDCDNLTS